MEVDSNRRWNNNGMGMVHSVNGGTSSLVVDSQGNLLVSLGSTSPTVVNQPNTSATLLASAARTSSTQSADQTNASCKSVVVFLNVTSAAGTGGLTVRILGKDPASGNYFLLNAAPTVVNSIGQYGFVLGPGCVSSGGSIWQTTATVLPLAWAVQVAHSDSSSYTYSLAASVVN